MGVGRATGADKAATAAEAAIKSPLLESSIDGAKGVLINVTASPEIDLAEVELACKMITDAADPNANIFWGTAFDENFNDDLLITVIATGFDDLAQEVNSSFGITPDKEAESQAQTQTPIEKVDEEDPFDFDKIMKILEHRNS